MSQERLKVLELLSSGKINADQAAELLRNLSAAPPPPPAPEVEPVADSAETSASAEPENANDTVEFVKELGDLKAQVRVAAKSADAEADAGSAKRVRTRIRIEEDGKSAESSADDETPSGEPTRLRIRVTDDSGKQRVNIGIPFKLLQFGVNIGERFAPELGEWDWQKLDIDIEDGEGHVRIFVE